MTEITIRPFEDDTLDRAGLVDVVTGAFVHDRWITDPALDARKLRPMFADGALEAAVRSVDQPATHFCLLACTESEIVGVALGHIEGRILEFSEARVGTLWSLAVKENARRQGIATRLFEAAREWMEARECVELTVSTDAPNPAAELYDKLGGKRHHTLITWTFDL